MARKTPEYRCIREIRNKNIKEVEAIYASAIAMMIPWKKKIDDRRAAANDKAQ